MLASREDRLILGPFSVRFLSCYVFSTTSPLRFPVRSGSFFVADPVFSVTSPVRFLKNVFFVPQFQGQKSDPYFSIIYGDIKSPPGLPIQVTLMLDPSLEDYHARPVFVK